jgi:hypothetical protein
MAGSPVSAESLNEMREAHKQFLDGVENDILGARTINKKWKKTYIGNCRRIRNEMYEFQFEFIEETLVKINEALQLNENDSRRNDIYNRFQMVFDEIAVRCTHVDNQMKTILTALAAQDPSLARKYGIFRTVGVGTALVGSALVGVLVGHFLPAAVCSAALGPVAVPIIIAGAVVLSVTAIVTLCKARLTKNEQKVHANVYNWAAQSFPTFGKLGPHDKCTDKEIEEKFHKILCTMAADEAVWKSNAMLKELKTSLEKNALRLTNEKARVEKQDAALVK